MYWGSSLPLFIHLLILFIMLTFLKLRKTILNVLSIVFVLFALYLLVFFAKNLPAVTPAAGCVLVFGAVLFFAVAYLFVWCQSLMR